MSDGADGCRFKACLVNHIDFYIAYLDTLIVDDETIDACLILRNSTGEGVATVLDHCIASVGIGRGFQHQVRFDHVFQLEVASVLTGQNGEFPVFQLHILCAADFVGKSVDIGLAGRTVGNTGAPAGKQFTISVSKVKPPTFSKCCSVVSVSAGVSGHHTIRRIVGPKSVSTVYVAIVQHILF